ncbi:MAG: malonate decarboxylase holo-[acyl-carrier-protein] synthase [Tropicimonas sp.]|uniref:malonate decarboxylase holo-[acyl-carrier-protein] synthase n=1 Tax=Tropicimonas sp. TaxID=2067044 RepID=UPI003A88664D
MLDTRHILAFPTEGARAELLPAILGGLPDPMRTADIRAKVHAAITRSRIPGIVCRPTQPVPKGGGQIGFSFPFRLGGQRVRSAVAVRAGQIADFVTPWQVMAQAVVTGDAAHPAIGDLDRIGARTGVEIGLIGSVAMQVATGLSYLHGGSDIDIVTRAASAEQLAALWHEIAALGGARVDAEIALPGGLGVKLAEYMSGAGQLLAKSISDVRLIERSHLEAMVRQSWKTGETPLEDHPRKQTERNGLWM